MWDSSVPFARQIEIFAEMGDLPGVPVDVLSSTTPTFKELNVVHFLVVRLAANKKRVKFRSQRQNGLPERRGSFAERPCGD